MAEKVSRDRGYRSDTIAVSRDMGPLRLQTKRLQCQIYTTALLVSA